NSDSDPREVRAPAGHAAGIPTMHGKSWRERGHGINPARAGRFRPFAQNRSARLAVPERFARALGPYDYLICVNRADGNRTRFHGRVRRLEAEHLLDGIGQGRQSSAVLSENRAVLGENPLDAGKTLSIRRL